jgi:hypothetical protein
LRGEDFSNHDVSGAEARDAATDGGPDGLHGGLCPALVALLTKGVLGRLGK